MGISEKAVRGVRKEKPAKRAGKTSSGSIMTRSTPAILVLDSCREDERCSHSRGEMCVRERERPERKRRKRAEGEIKKIGLGFRPLLHFRSERRVVSESKRAITDNEMRE